MRQTIEDFLRLTIPTLLLVTLLLEILLRVGLPASNPPMGWFDQAHRIYQFRANGQTGLVTIGPLAQQRARWRVNNAGWNSPIDYKEIKTRPRIAVIGDSYIEAFQVDADKSFPSILRGMLHDTHDVFSFGVSGAPMSQYLHMARYAVAEYDTDVLIFNIVHNDFDESVERLNPGDRHWLRIRLDEDSISESVPQADPNFTQFSLTKRILRKSALIRYFAFNVRLKETIEQLFEEERVYVGNIDPAAVTNQMRDMRRAIRYIMNRMRVEFAGRRIIFVMDAPRASIYSGVENSDITALHELMRTECARAGFELLDLTGPMRAEYELNQQRFETPWDGHWNEYGHRFVAGQVATHLQKSHELQISPSR